MKEMPTVCTRRISVRHRFIRCFSVKSSHLKSIAGVAELVDAHASEACERKFVQVRLLSSVPD